MDALTHTRARRSIAAAIVAVGIAVAGVAPATAATAPDDQIAAATNSYRSANGVKPLARHGGVDVVAQAWAEWMLKNDTFKHNPNYFSQMPSAGLSSGGENIVKVCSSASASTKASKAMQLWKDSPGHRQNMLNSRFNSIGVGVAHDGYCLYAVQNFATYSYTPSSTQFWDVPKSHQFYDEITWLAGTGITTGYSDGSYRPSQEVTREAFAAFMYRLAGEPRYTAPSRSPFSDVSTRSQFYKEISWVASTGISTGWADGTFRPKDDISREAMAAFLYRYHDQPATKVNAATRFKDLGWGDRFLREISWLANEGITTGYSDGTFKPHNSVTREAMAAFLERAAD